MPKKDTKETFIEKSSIHHKDKNYDYSLVNYVNSKTKVNIICPKHGIFAVRPNNHVLGTGCPKCANILIHEKQTSTTEEFIKKAKKIHGNKYDYSKVNYTKALEEVEIICSKHGSFFQVASYHLSGNGCLRCSLDRVSYNKDIILKKFLEVHGEKYSYEWVSHFKLRSPKKVKIFCKKCNDFFFQELRNHIRGHGCSMCQINLLADLNRVPFEKFKEKAENKYSNKYNYFEKDYKDSQSLISIYCKSCGKFFKSLVYYHLLGKECPRCVTKIGGRKVLDLIDFLDDHNVNYEINHYPDFLKTKKGKGKELDFYFPDKNIAFEINGVYWHSERFKSKKYHLEKQFKCEENGVKLIHIFEHFLFYKKDIVFSRIENILNLCKNKIYARECEIKYLNKKEKKEFLELNHLQGSCGSSIDLGLFFKGKLVSIMTFGKRRLPLNSLSLNNNDYEMLRFCSKTYCHIVGGASKLLSFFERNHNPKTIVTYADKCWSFGNLYEKLGFRLDHVSSPNYWYFKKYEVFHRFTFAKHKLPQKIKIYNQNKTEWENMKENGWNRYWDCGNMVYIKEY